LLRTPQNGSEPAKEDVGKPVQPLGDASVVQSPIPVIPQSRQGNQETPVPEEFNPSANPLLFPTQTEEVQIQRTQPITLQQTLELARRNNRELEAAKLTLERTQSALQEALAAEFPTAGVVADFTRTESAQSNLSNQPQDQDIVSRSFNGALQLSYDLYTAGRRSATIRAAEGQVRFQELEVESLSEQLRLNVTRAYYDLQQADAQVEISQAAVTDAARSLRDAQLLEQAGLGTQFDVLQAQVSLAGANQDLTRAISQQRISRRQIVRLLSLAQPVEISAADPIETAGDWELSLEQSIILAYKNRAELEQQLVQRDISEQQRRIALAAVRPQATLSASYNILGVLDDDLGPTDGFTLGARLQWNFFDGGAARARAQQERTNIAIAETRFADQRNQVRFDVEQAFFDLNANKENIQTASFALTQAQESLRLARLRFQAGVGTQADVITQQTELTRARGRRLTAILDYNRALAALQRAVTNLQGSNLFDLP
jgi:OMF family outer membrane factor